MSTSRLPNETFAEFCARVQPVEVTFKRTFLSGALKGLTIEDSLRFSTVADAVEWIDGVAGHPEIHSALLPNEVQV